MWVLMGRGSEEEPKPVLGGTGPVLLCPGSLVLKPWKKASVERGMARVAMTCVSKCYFLQALGASHESVPKKVMKIRVDLHLQRVPCSSQKCKKPDYTRKR